MKYIQEILNWAPSEAWVGLIGVFFGAFISMISAFISASAANKQLKFQLEHEKVRASKTLKREKMEELYLLLDKWLNSFFSRYMKLTLVMKGSISYNDYLDQINSDPSSSNVDFSRLAMIIEIYGSELSDIYKSVLDARSSLNDIDIQHKHAYKAGDVDGRRFIEPFTGAQVELESRIELLKSKVAEVARGA